MATQFVPRLRFTPYTSIPATLDPATAIEVRIADIIEIFTRVTAAGATQGQISLLIWVPEAGAMGAGEWHTYRNSQDYDTSVRQGKIHATWNVDKDTPAYYQLLVEGAVTVPYATIQGIRHG